LWFTDDIKYASRYSHGGKLIKCKIKIENPYIREGYPVSCPYETFIDLYKPKYKEEPYSDVPYFHQDGDVRFNKKWRNYFMGLAFDVGIGDKPHYKLDKKGNKDYEWDSTIYWQVLDILNAKKARELGYDAIIYEMKGYGKDEYCILYPKEMILSKEEVLQ